MHRREQLEAEGRLEPVDEVRHPVEALPGLGRTAESLGGVLDGAGHQLQLLVGPVAAVAVSRYEVPLHRVEDVPQVLGVRPVVPLGVLEPQALARDVHEVHQLVDFQQGDEGVEQTVQVAVHQPDERCPARCHLRDLLALHHPLRRRRAPWLEDDDIQVVEAAQCLLDARAHVAPFEAAEAAAERRHRDRADVALADHHREVLEPGVDILDPAVAAPMPLGREVDDVARIGELPRLEHEHAAGLDLATRAGVGVDAEVLGERLLELKRDPAPHDADAVDRVDQGLGIFGKDVAGCEANHRRPLRVINNTTPAES